MKVEDLDDLQTAEWSLRQLLKALLKAAEAEPALAYPSRLMQAGAEGVLRRCAGIMDPDDRMEAVCEVEMLVEAVLRLGLHGGDAIAKAGRTTPARGAKKAIDSARAELQVALLKRLLGGRPVVQPYKIKEELFGTEEARTALNAAAKSEGLPAFSDSTLARLLVEMKKTPD